MYMRNMIALAAVLSAGGVLAEVSPKEMVTQRISARLVLDHPDVTPNVIKAYFKYTDPAVRRFLCRKNFAIYP